VIDRALPGVAPTRSRFDEPTLDQLLAEPIVQQLMRRDSIDEATIRQLLQKTASARLASRAEDDLKADSPLNSATTARDGLVVVQSLR
jgi:hypothetical protein